MGDKQQEIGKVKAKSDDSAWTLEESEVLLQLLIEATLCGWRDANGLLTKDICNKTCKHYTSRMIYFKKEYGKYSQFMGSNSGFGWDANTKRFVADDQTKEAFVNKSCDDLEDLQIVLGDATDIGKHSLGLGEETDARTFVVKDRQGGIEEDEQVGIENLFYDEENRGFVLNQNQTSSFNQSSPFLPTQATSSEIPPPITNHRQLIKLELWKIFHLLSIQLPPTSEESIVYWRKWIRIERQNSIWDAIKETPNLDEFGYDAFMKMLPEEQSNWICYNLKWYVI
ncbi:hypothetical protein D8674_026967 [Pyrus ussuriensis x Pyrus communis]|uniref:Myb/SANT-like domain-containing protein n=1 Tax=Pyrus ussuriensis x Pyrus communis TaxID=2448454 RepID=A0A5N5IBE8_9ROSA|nr:hypothetical protein D8674_026967 [Pyrus ussuriensis x Pyrus communis]